MKSYTSRCLRVMAMRHYWRTEGEKARAFPGSAQPRRTSVVRTVMHMSTRPCDFGHRLLCLLRSSLRSNDAEIHRVGCAGYTLLAERAGWVRVTQGRHYEPRAAKRFDCSRSLLLPGISPQDFAGS